MAAVKRSGWNGSAFTSLQNDPANGGTPTFVIPYAFDGAVAANPTVCVAEFPFRVLDFHCIATEANGDGTVQVDNGSSAIATAIACATDGAVARMAAGVDDTKWKLSRGSSLKLTIANSAAGVIYITCARDNS